MSREPCDPDWNEERLAYVGWVAENWRTWAELEMLQGGIEYPVAITLDPPAEGQ
jgi:hypothetical protein